MSDDRFPKANLFKVEIWPRSWMKVPFFHYVRLANASQFRIGRIVLTWRRGWLPQAAYMEGWNACFREVVLHQPDAAVRENKREDDLLRDKYPYD